MAEITIKSVEGNPLNINVVMTAVEHSMLNGEIVTETVDFYPDTSKPVRAYLDCTTARKQFCPTTYVDGNIVYLSCDNATAGVYTLTVTCTDTNGKARRYKSDACIEVYDLTSAAEIAGSFDEQTYEMNGVFYTFGGGGTVQSDWDETNPESPAYILNKPDLSDYATDEELQAVEEQIPNVPEWAQQPQKPSYTAGEVGAVPTSRTVNGKALSEDITLNAQDVGAQTPIADLAQIREGAAKGATAYQKPSTGIAKSDLTNGIQQSLDRADTALQAAALTPLQNQIDTINNKIPTDATSTNELADKNYVERLVNEKQDTINDLDAIRRGAAKGATAYQLPSNGMPKTDLAVGVQQSLDKANTAYQKPSAGIPKTDLAQEIQQRLDIPIDDEPTAGSNNLVKSGGVYNELVLGAVYDVSSKNPTAGPNNDGKWESLSALLSDANLYTIIPTSVRKGGMSIKFVQSSDNKYVQFRYMGTSTEAADFTNIANWQGVDDEPTAGSDNLVNSGGVFGKEKEIRDKISFIERTTVQEVNQIQSIIKALYNDTLYITDNLGNVICKIDATGISAKNITMLLSIVQSNKEYINLINNIIRTEINDKFYLSDPYGNVIAFIDKNGIHAKNIKAFEESIHIDFQTDSFYLTDLVGNVIAKLSAYGLETPIVKTNKIIGITNNGIHSFWGNYELFSLGDSLSAGGVWQTEVSKIIGCKFNQSKNSKPGSQLSTGGTINYGDGFDNGLWRTKHLVDEGYITDDGENAVVIIENVNDFDTAAFDGSARTLVLTDPIEGEYMFNDWGTSLLQSVPSADRKINAVLKLLEISSGKNLSITTLPQRDGSVKLTIYERGAGTLHYNIQVSSSDTLQTLLNKILEYNYTRVFDTLADDDESVNFVGTLTDGFTISFTDTDNTGMTVSITDTNNAKRERAAYFIGDSVVSDWENTEKWLLGSDMSFSTGIKSMVEMLQAAYPQIHIVISAFPRRAVTAANYLLPSGAYNSNAYYNALSDERKVIGLYKSVSEFYGLPFINVGAEWGVGITNHTEYYPATANVHPQTEGYLRIGQTVSAALSKYII